MLTVSLSPKIGFDAFGSDGDIDQYSCTGSQVLSRIVFKPIIHFQYLKVPVFITQGMHLSLFTAAISILGAGANGTVGS